jgi:uncharacterized membrane protein YbhN (UPF0104 family)
MKKLHLLVLAGVALVAVSVYAIEQVRRDAAGLHIGSAVTDRIGMWGATPVVRQTITNTAPAAVALTQAVKAAATQAALTVSSATITYQGVDGSTNSISVVTNVTINTVWGFATTTPQVLATSTVNEVYGYTTSNQLNAVRNALVNVGIASTTGQ